MKLNAKTRAAIRAKVEVKKPAVTAKAKSKKQEVKPASLGKPVSRSVMVALLSGSRGFAARQVEVTTYKNGKTIKALQNNKGLAMRDGTPAELIGDKLTSKAPKQARIELGGYVNGRNTGAKVELLTEAQFVKRAKSGVVHWSADDTGIAGSFIGDASQKGMVAVRVPYKNFNYYWQMESDSNVHNKHERGEVTTK